MQSMLAASGAAPGFDATRWLGETRQLDTSDSRLRITAQKLTQSLQSWPERAAAIQAFVRRLPFAASEDSGRLRASEVLRRGNGDCHSKGVLFAALCRASGLPARLQFMGVRTRFLAGLLDEGPGEMPHAVGQVLLDSRWASTDGYVVDPVLFAHGKHLLREHGLDAGWGLVREARGLWNGQGDCLHQFRAADVTCDYGTFDDPAGFHAVGPRRAQGWSTWLKFTVGAHLLNRRVAHLRHAISTPVPAEEIAS